MHLDEGALHAYLDGELDDAAVGDLERHIESCSACRGRVDEAASERALASDLLADLAAAGEPIPDWETLVARAAERRESAAANPVASRPWAPGAVLAWAATLVLAFAIGWQASRFGLGESPDSRPVAEPQAVDVAPEAALGIGAAREPGAPVPRAVPEERVAGVESPSDDGAGAEPRAAPPPDRVAVLDVLADAPAGPLPELEDGNVGAFRPIPAEEAAMWLGAAPLQIDGALRLSTTIGPPSELPGAEPGRVVLRTEWELATGGRVTLLQQHRGAESNDMRGVDVEPSGLREQPRQSVARRRVAPLEVPIGGARLEGRDAVASRVTVDGEAQVSAELPTGYRVIVASRELDVDQLAALLTTLR